MHPQWPIFADTHKSSRVIFRCIFGIKDFIKIILSPFSYNMYICILNIFTIKRDSLQCIPIFYIQNCNFSISIGHFPFHVKISFICMRIYNNFHINGFALSLSLKQRLGPTWKWPIKATAMHEFRTKFLAFCMSLKRPPASSLNCLFHSTREFFESTEESFPRRKKSNSSETGIE